MEIERRQRRTKPRNSSFFTKMVEATIHRPKNYSTFHTECDSISYQGKAKNAKNVDNDHGEQESANSSMNWKAEWMKGSAAGSLASGSNPALTAAQESEIEKKLRSENDELKCRLNAANNAIRDLERAHRQQEKKAIRELVRARKKQDKLRAQAQAHGRGLTTSISPLRSFVDFIKNKNEVYIDGDDQSSVSAAVASTASTVQMGSSSKNTRQARKARKKARRKSNDDDDADDKQKSGKIKMSCSKALIYGKKLRKKIAATEAMRRSRNRGAFEVTQLDATPPCTPERKSSTEYHISDRDLFEDISSGIVGIDIVKKNSRRGKKREETLSCLSTMTLLSKKSELIQDNSSNVDQCSFKRDYPIDLYPATPIFEENFSNQEEFLSTIHESNETNSEECASEKEDRVEI